MRASSIAHAQAPQYKLNQEGAFRRYSTFATLSGMPAVPVTFDTLSLWACSRVANGTKVSTVTTGKRNLKAYCLRHRVPFPTSSVDAERWRQLIKGFQAANPAAVRRATPLLDEHLQRMFAARDMTTARDEQSYLAALLAKKLCLRACQLCMLNHASVRVRDNGMVAVDVPGVKAQRTQPPKERWIAPMALTSSGQADPLDAARRLAFYHERLATAAAAFPSLPLFPKLANNAAALVIKSPPVRMTYPVWRARFRIMVHDAGLSTHEFTTHACRAGFITEQISNGVKPAVAALHGGWTSSRWQQYYRPDEESLARERVRATQRARTSTTASV